MATITYTVTGTYPPFGVELRENNSEGNVINSIVHEIIGTYEFNDVLDGTYVIVTYDVVGGVNISNEIIVDTMGI